MSPGLSPSTRIAAFGGLLALIAALSGCGGGVENPNGGSADPRAEMDLVGGENAREGDFPQVFIFTSGDDLEGSFCTATKITDTLFLTAAHCVLRQEASPGQRYAGAWRTDVEPGATITYSFTRRMSVSAKRGVMAVRAVHLPPTLQACLNEPEHPGPGCDRGRAPLPDVAVVEVAGIDGAFAKAPRAALRFDPVRTGRPVTLVGYGSHRDNDTTKPRLRFHAATVASARAIQRALVGTEAELDGAPDESLFFGSLGNLDSPQRANLGSGDSGGPVFSAGDGAIVGVNSDGFCPIGDEACQRTTNSFFARLEKGAPHGIGEWLSGLGLH